MKALIKRINRKCWKHITAIRTASNMIEIQSLISDILIDTFEQRNLGIQKIQARNTSKITEFENRQKIRLEQLNKHREFIKNYCVTLIPDKFKHTLLYQELTKKDVVIKRSVATEINDFMRLRTL